MESEATMDANRLAQKAIDEALEAAETWSATLPFDKVEGFGGATIDLFDFTCSKAHKRVTCRTPPKVIFDRALFPATKDGVSALTKEIKTIGMIHGTVLVNSKDPLILSCQRCRTHKSHKKKRTAGEAMDDEGETDDIEFDDDGVKVGMRECHFHRDNSHRRAGGKKLSKSRSTALPLEREETCKVCLRFGMTVEKEEKDSFIFLKQGCGSSKHTGHPRVMSGDLHLKKRHLDVSTQQLIRDGGRAAVGGGSLRNLVLTNQQSLVSRGTMARIRMIPACLEEESSQEKSTATHLIEWLCEKAQDEEVNLRHCFLSTKQQHVNHHKHAKGRPPKEGRMPLKQVQENLTYVDVLQSTHNTAGAAAETGGTPPAATAAGAEATEELAMDPELGKCAKSALDCQSELRIEQTTKVLLGAAWTDEDGFRQFLRFPEVLFCDTTHKTNNEARPLLLVCGRDQNGNAFIVVRIFMPNETAAFFCWVFLKCLPTLLGKENLSRAKLLITDGDSAEFEAVEESIFAHFSQAIRGRCCHHVVQKTFEKSVNEGSMPHPTLAGSFLREVKTWIHSWSDGSSCFTKEQCELSKDLLIHTIQNDNNTRRVFVSAGCEKVVETPDQML